MMSRTIPVLLLISSLAIGLNLLAGQKEVKTGKKMFMPPVYIGNSDYSGGPIQREKFVSLMKQGLISHDSLGNKYKIIGFQFSYAEPKIYEDSVGNLIKVTDFNSEFCMGDTLGADLTTYGDTSQGQDVTLSLYQRVKGGDTLYFDHIMVEKRGKNSLMSIADTIPIEGRAVKCVIAN